VFHAVSDEHAAELYRLRAEQLARSGNAGARAELAPTPTVGDADSFWAAVAWAHRSDIVRRVLLDVASRQEQWVPVSEVCQRQQVDPAKARGALGAFFRNANKLGFGSSNPVLRWRQDGMGRVSYWLTPEQALVIREVLGGERA
jgi:hypothetical protein